MAMECQEHSKWKLHAHRMDILRRKEQARSAVLHMAEAEFRKGLRTCRHSTDAAAADVVEQHRDIGDPQPTLAATVNLEERSDGSFRLLINPAALSLSEQQSPDAEGSAPGILTCLKA